MAYADSFKDFNNFILQTYFDVGKYLFEKIGVMAL